MKSEINQIEDLTLKINEIFYSIQGESTQSGRPCIFIRLTYCNLRCTYCDTEYAFFEGQDLSIKAILDELGKYNCNLIEITGGEPLIQKNVHHLMKLLCDRGYEIMLETAGHLDISTTDSRVKRIMDIKCPSSGESDKILWENIKHLKNTDEIKFVVSTSDDLSWAQQIIEKYNLTKICPVIFSPVYGEMDNEILAQWIMQSGLPVRMQIQLHKQIWSPQTRGV
jgi:7-carboxy-7-deazaguanine synthase